MKPHVLVVDDDLGIQQLISELLLIEGYTVSTAHHGGPALVEMFGRAGPLVVTLGLVMPGMDGEQVLEWVAANPKVASRHRIIMVTGSTERATSGRVAELRQQLGIPLLPKPFTAPQILDAVFHAAAEIESREQPAP